MDNAALDPAYRSWHDQRNAEDHAEFEAWLDSPEERALLEIDDERAARRFETYTHAGEEKRVDTSYWENVDISL